MAPANPKGEILERYEFGFAEVKKAAGVWVRIRAILNGIE